MIIEQLEAILSKRNLNLADFRMVVQRLLDRQVIYRNESITDSKAYDLFIRMEDLIDEYLTILGVKVLTNSRLNYIIAYPPGSNIPGIDGTDNDTPVFQRRIRSDEAGLMLTLRLLYEERIREGDVSDDGSVNVPLEEVFTRFMSITRNKMPTSETERRSLFNTLRKLRIVNYTDLTRPDQWIAIREIILHFTLDSIAERITAYEDHDEINDAQ